MSQRLRSSLLGVCAALGTACSIEAPDFSGKSCDVAADCPETHVCVAARPGAGRTCELLQPPGVLVPEDVGPVPTWCKDIQPVMQASCVSSCHGEVTGGSGRADFRLDVYDATGNVAGAKQMAARIQDRGFTQRSMPPSYYTPQPSDEQRTLLDRWVRGGMPLCDDTGDAGSSDAGSSDGGRSDAGPSDAGTRDGGTRDGGP